MSVNYFMYFLSNKFRCFCHDFEHSVVQFRIVESNQSSKQFVSATWNIRMLDLNRNVRHRTPFEKLGVVQLCKW